MIFSLQHPGSTELLPFTNQRGTQTRVTNQPAIIRAGCQCGKRHGLSEEQMSSFHAGLAAQGIIIRPMNRTWLKKGNYHLDVVAAKP